MSEVYSYSRHVYPGVVSWIYCTYPAVSDIYPVVSRIYPVVSKINPVVSKIYPVASEIHKMYIPGGE